MATTVVGERGLTHSGGQRQRVASPGAAGRPAHPGSSMTQPPRLTPPPSSRFAPGWPGSWPGRTTFVISHRLSTISLADEGPAGARPIQDRGTVAELTERSPLFRELTPAARRGAALR